MNWPRIRKQLERIEAATLPCGEMLIVVIIPADGPERARVLKEIAESDRQTVLELGGLTSMSDL